MQQTNVNISHFTVTTSKREGIHDGISLGNGLKYIFVHYVKILDCDFYNLDVACCGSSDIIVSNCKFWDCARAITIGEKGNYVISNCDITAPGDTSSIAIFGGNTTVSNCTFHPGKIWIHDSDNNRLINNYIVDGYIQIEYSSHNILRNNTLKNSGLEFFGHGVEDFHHDIDASNTMQGKPIYYFYDKKDMVIDKKSNTGYIILALCQNIMVRDLDLYGSVLAFSSNSTFENCSFYRNSVGLYLHKSTYNSILRCNFENRYPLMIEQSCRNNISYCTFSNTIQIWHSSNENIVMGCTLNGGGIYLGDAHNNTVTKCSISNSGYGIEIDGNDNLVSLCNISYNKMGVFVDGYSNRIYLNNFIENSINAFCYGQNIWNTREKGNYWDDYRGFDLNKDGIGFIPYHIRTDYIWSIFNFDWRPLMHPL
jgi:parallel beta-helix repeat protein